nr:hypothetical protein [Tanacetum cinerariifolium]
LCWNHAPLAARLDELIDNQHILGLRSKVVVKLVVTAKVFPPKIVRILPQSFKTPIPSHGTSSHQRAHSQCQHNANSPKCDPNSYLGLVDKYDLETLCKTNTIISLADRSTKIPRGILEDVIVKVDDFYYPVDFFVMDTESPYKDVQPNIILGRPFLATVDARINCRTGPMGIAFGNRKLRLNVFNSLNSPISNDCYHIDTIDECIKTHTPSMNLDHTLENLHYVDIEKELFDGMMFHEKEEEFQLIEEEFLLSLEETPLQSQQVQQSTLNEVQEYVDCLLVHQDVLLRARGSNKGNGCVRKRSRRK